MLMACTDKKQTTDKDMKQELTLTQEWDKVFPQSDKVEHSKITFHNRYGITLVADMYVPQGTSGKLPAIAVSGPFGAVKEQVSGLYAQTLAERGFVTIAFDPRSQARAVVSPVRWPRPTSTPRTSSLPSISSLCRRMLTLSASASWASADGEAWL